MPQYQVTAIICDETPNSDTGQNLPRTIYVSFCCVSAASWPSVFGQGGAGAGVQFPGWHSEGESAEGHGAGVS